MLKKMIWQLLNYLNKYVAASRMVSGYTNYDRAYVANTRISTTCTMINKKNLVLADNIFIGHYNFIEASNGVTIGEGCQISNFVSIITHSSHISIRLYGKNYTNHKNHQGYLAGSITIGAYSFIGPHTTIMPNTFIGKGSIVTAYSLVKGGTFPDFAIISGNPAQVVGDTRETDTEYLNQDPQLQHYYNEWINDKNI